MNICNCFNRRCDFLRACLDFSHWYRCLWYSMIMQDSGEFILWNCVYLELPISGMEFSLILRCVVYCYKWISSKWEMQWLIVDTYMLAFKSDTGVCWLIFKQATFCMVPIYYELLVHNEETFYSWFSSNFEQLYGWFNILFELMAECTEQILKKINKTFVVVVLKGSFSSLLEIVH